MKTFNKGISTIATLLMLMSLTVIGLVLAYLVSAGLESRNNYLLSQQAFYVTQAGIEHAVKKIYEGESETVSPPGKVFGTGSFTVSRSGRTLTVTGTVHNTVRVHNVDSPTQAECMTIEIENFNLQQNETVISQVTFRKVCLTSITINQMTLSWTPDNGERLKKIRIENATIYDNPAGSSSGTLLDTADYTTPVGNNNVINKIEWDSSMEDKEITITFYMGDASTDSTFLTADD